MNTSVRTTIMIPRDLLKEAKIAAVERQTSLSELIKTGLEKEINQENKVAHTDNSLLKLIGKRRIGIKKFNREELYDDYLKRKLFP